MKNDQKYDFLGITLSILCGIHCLVTPLVIFYFPNFGDKLQSPWTQSLLLVLIAWVFYQSVYVNYKKHRSKITIGLGLSGFSTLLFVFMMEIFSGHNEHAHHHHEAGFHEEPLTLTLAILGTIFMVSSHLLNIKNCKCNQQV